MSANRDTRIDSLKYWLIVLVIAGHVFLQCGSHRVTNQITWHWIYLFHMPLFIFLSGYFSHKKTNQEFINSSLKILEPYVVFQLIARGFDYLKGEPITLINLLTPRYVLWYLLSLFCWRLMLQILPDKILKNSKLVIISTLVVSIIAGFLPFNNFLTLQRTFAFLPYFFIGYYMREKNLFIPKKYRPWCICFLIATIIIPVFFSDYLGDLFRIIEYDSIKDAYRRVFTTILSIPMSIAFIAVCPNFHWTAKQGRYTMQYFIYHPFMVIVLLLIVDKCNLPTSFFYVLIYTITIVVLLGFASYLPVFEKLTNPLSFLKESIRSSDRNDDAISA